MVILGECAITEHQILVMDYKSSLRRMSRSRKRKTQINRTEQNKTLYFDREVSVHIQVHTHA